MTSVSLIKDIQFVLEETEEKVWKKVEGFILNMYWQIGYCLRDYSEEEVQKMGKEFALLFKVEEQLFCIAYRFYKENPLKLKVERKSG